MAVKIGFVDMEIPDEVRDEEKVTKQGKRALVDKTKDVYLSEKKIKELEAEYDTVVVHDFGDDYHLTEEEKAKRNQYYNAFKELNVCKHKFRRLDEFIRVTRLALHCLDLVAENNMIYNPEEFKIRCLQGKIKVHGLFFPEYKGKDKKSISWKYVSEVILSGDDPSELMKPKEEVFSTSELDDMTYKLFDEEEVRQFEKMTENRKEENHNSLLKLIKDGEKEEDEDIVKTMKKKEVKEMFKTYPELVMAIRDIKKEMRKESRSINTIAETFASELTYDDMEKIERYDAKHNYAGLSATEMPKFKGCLLNDKDFDRYMYELQNYADDTIQENYGGKMRSLSEIRELKLKEALEENNWNIRNLYNNRELEKERKRMRKEGKKKEKKIKDRLLRIQEENKKRNKRLMGEDYDDDKPKKKKKKKKKGV